MLARTSAVLTAACVVVLSPLSCTTEAGGPAPQPTSDASATEPPPDATSTVPSDAEAEAEAGAAAEGDAGAAAEAGAETDAAALPDAGCGLGPVWLAAPAGVIHDTDKDPTVLAVRGHAFRLVLSDEQVVPQVLHLYVERDGAAYVELGGCVVADASPPVCSAALVIHSHGLPGWGTATGTPPALLANGDALVAFYETIVPRSFGLVALDPESGVVVRRAVAPQAGEGQFLFATRARRVGDDVHVFGSTTLTFPGETGAGTYFELVYPAFATPSCTLVETAPTSVRRSPDPLDGP